MLSLLFHPKKAIGTTRQTGFLFLVIVVFTLGGSLSAAASEQAEPFYSRNQNPFVQIYGLPATEGGDLLPPQSLDTRLAMDFANNFTTSATASESIHLDGETWRTTLALRYGLRNDLEIGLDLPYVDHSGGIFDGLIEGWHDLWGLPQGNRNQTQRGQLAYRYAENEGTKANVNAAGSGPGDLLLSLGVPLQQGTRALALRTTVKLPTGSPSELHGSGSTDFSLRICGEDHQTLSPWDLTYFGNAGVLLMTKGDILPDRQRHVVWFGSAGFTWQPLTWLALKAQFDGHTPFYTSDLHELGSTSAQLVFGGTLALPEDLFVDIGMAEDVIVDTAPDAVFHFMLRRRF